MPAPWVLLEPYLVFGDESKAAKKGEDGEPIYQLIGCWAGLLMVEDEAPIGGQSERVALEAAATRRAGKQPAAGGSVGEKRRMAQAIKLFSHFADPPQVSNLALVLLEPEKEVEMASLTSIDRNLFLFYAGPWMPSWRNTGYYLIHDAAKNSMTVIPGTPLIPYDQILGSRAVLLRSDEEGGYVIAELIFNRAAKQFTLWMLKSSTAEWIQTVANIPCNLDVLKFHVDKAFTFQGSCLCWVDLFQGILICDMSGTDPRFCLVPLPDELVLPQDTDRPVELCNMSCINGSIKFCYVENKQPATVRIWKLESVDPVKWTIIWNLCFEELWADASFSSSGVPKWVPMFPTPIPEQDCILYFTVDSWCYKYMDRKVKLDNYDFIVCVNLQTKKLESWSSYRTRFMPVPALLPQPVSPRRNIE